MQIVDFVFGIMLVLLVAATAWMVWSAHRERPGRRGRSKSSQRTIDDQALAAKLARKGVEWERALELNPANDTARANLELARTLSA